MPFIPPLPCDSARIQLRPVHVDDIADLFEMNRDDLTTRYLPYASWQSLEDGAAWSWVVVLPLEEGSGVDTDGLQCRIVRVELATVDNGD